MNVRWISIEEASELTGYSVGTLYRICRERKAKGLPGVFRNEGRNSKWKIKPDVVWPEMF